MSFNFVDRVSTYPNRYKVTKEDGTIEYLTLERADEPTVVGTLLNAETFNKAFGNIEPDLTGYATETYVNNAVKVAAPRNLLDNSNFTNPVNQRGQTSYTSGYGIDRWVATGSKTSWSIVDGGLEVYCTDTTSQPYIDQRIPEEKVSYTTDNGKKYTVAAKVNGSIYSMIVTVGGSEVLNVPFGSIGFVYSPSASLMVVRLNLLTAEASVIEWVALYEGEYTAETLPEYQPKGYGAELAECQRYYQVIANNGICYAGYVTGGSKTVQFGMKIAPMRIDSPSIESNNVDFTIRGSAGYLAQNSVDYTISLYIKNAAIGYIAFSVVFATALAENNVPVGIQAGGKLVLSADL